MAAVLDPAPRQASGASASAFSTKTWLTKRDVNHTFRDIDRRRRLTDNMVNGGGAKPNRRVEEALHHGPVTGIVDKILLSEIRRMGDGRGNTIASAHRTAIDVSWHLHRIASRKTEQS